MNLCHCCKSAHKDLKFDSSLNLITTADSDEEFLSDTLLAELGDRSLSWFDDLTEAHFIQQQEEGEKCSTSPNIVAGWSPCPRGGVFSVGNQVQRAPEMTPMTALLSSSGSSFVLKANSSSVMSSPSYEHLGADQEAIKWTSAMATPFQDGSSSSSLDQTDWRDGSTATASTDVTEMQEKPKVFHRQLFSPAQTSWANDSLSDVLEDGDITVEQERTLIKTDDSFLNSRTIDTASVIALDNENVNLNSISHGRDSVCNDKEMYLTASKFETAQQVILSQRLDASNSKPSVSSVVERNNEENIVDDASLCLDETLCEEEYCQSQNGLEKTNVKVEKRFYAKGKSEVKKCCEDDKVEKVVKIKNKSQGEETGAGTECCLNIEELNVDASFSESLTAKEMEMVEQQCANRCKVDTLNDSSVEPSCVSHKVLGVQRASLDEVDKLNESTDLKKLENSGHIEAVLSKVFSSQSSSSEEFDAVAQKKETDLNGRKIENVCCETEVDGKVERDKTLKTLVKENVNEHDESKDRLPSMSKKRQWKGNNPNGKKQKIYEQIKESNFQNKTNRPNFLLQDTNSKEGLSNFSRLLSDSVTDISIGSDKIFTTPVSILKSQPTPKSVPKKRVRFSIDSPGSDGDTQKASHQDGLELTNANDQQINHELFKSGLVSDQSAINSPACTNSEHAHVRAGTSEHSYNGISLQTVVSKVDTFSQEDITDTRIIGDKKSNDEEDYIDNHGHLTVIPDSEMDEFGNDDENLANFSISQLEKDCFDSNRNLVGESQDCNILLSSQVEDVPGTFGCDNETNVEDFKNFNSDKNTELSFDDYFEMSPTFTSQVLASSQVEGRDNISHENVCTTDDCHIYKAKCNLRESLPGKDNDPEKLNIGEEKTNKSREDVYSHSKIPQSSKSCNSFSSSTTYTALPDPLMAGKSSSSLSSSCSVLPKPVVSSSLMVSHVPVKSLPDDSKPMNEKCLLATPTHAVPLPVSKATVSEPISHSSTSQTSTLSVFRKRLGLFTNKPRKFLYPKVKEVEAIGPNVVPSKMAEIAQHTEETNSSKETSLQMIETKPLMKTPVISASKEGSTNYCDYLQVDFEKRETADGDAEGITGNCGPPRKVPRKVPKLLGFAKFSDVFQEQNISSDLSINSRSTATKTEDISVKKIIDVGNHSTTTIVHYKSLNAETSALHSKSHKSDGSISRNSNFEQFQESFHDSETKSAPSQSNSSNEPNATDYSNKFTTMNSTEGKTIEADEEMPQISSQVWAATEFSQMLKQSKDNAITSTMDDVTDKSWSEVKTGTSQFFSENKEIIPTEDVTMRLNPSCDEDELEKILDVHTRGINPVTNNTESSTKILDNKIISGFKVASNLSMVKNLDSLLSSTANTSKGESFEDQLENIFASTSRKEKSVIKQSFTVPFKNRKPDSYQDGPHSSRLIHSEGEANRNCILECESKKLSDKLSHRQQLVSNCLKENQMLGSSKLDDFDNFLNGLKLNVKENMTLPNANNDFKRTSEICNREDVLQQESFIQTLNTGKKNFLEIASLPTLSECGIGSSRLSEGSVDNAVVEEEFKYENQRKTTQLGGFSTAKGKFIHVSDQFKRQAEEVMNIPAVEVDMTLINRADSECNGINSMQAEQKQIKGFDIASNKQIDLSSTGPDQTEEFKESTEVLNDIKLKESSIWKHEKANVQELRLALKRANTEGLMSVLNNPTSSTTGFATAGGKQIALTETSKAKARQLWETLGTDLDTDVPDEDNRALHTASVSTTHSDVNTNAKMLKIDGSSASTFSSAKNILETSRFKTGSSNPKGDKQYKGFHPFKPPQVLKKLPAEKSVSGKSSVKENCDTEVKVQIETGLQSDVPPRQMDIDQCDKDVADDWEDDSNFNDLIEAEKNINEIIERGSCEVNNKNLSMAAKDDYQKLFLESKDSPQVEHVLDANLEKPDEVSTDKEQICKFQSGFSSSTINDESPPVSDVDLQRIRLLTPEGIKTDMGNYLENKLKIEKDIAAMSGHCSLASVGDTDSRKFALISNSKVQDEHENNTNYNSSAVIENSGILVKDNEINTAFSKTNVLNSKGVCFSTDIVLGSLTVDNRIKSDFDKHLTEAANLHKPESDSIEINRMGFSTASGIKISISDKALQHTKNFFDESEKTRMDQSNNISEKTVSPKKINGLSKSDHPNSSIPHNNRAVTCETHTDMLNNSKFDSPLSSKTLENRKGCLLKCGQGNTTHTMSSPPSVGFSTASGLKVSISERALKQARDFLNESDSSLNTSKSTINPPVPIGRSTSNRSKTLVSDNHGQDFVVQYPEELTQAKANTALSVPMDFSTANSPEAAASDKSDTVIEHAQELLIEYDSCLLNKETASKLINVPSMSSGFSTANGSKVVVSDKAMRQTKDFFKECESDVLSEGNSTNPTVKSVSVGFETASELKCYTPKKDVQNLCAESDEHKISSLVSEDRNTKSVVTPQVGIGFSTASGCKVSVSENAMKYAKDFFLESDSGGQDEDVTKAKTNTSSSFTIGFSTASGCKVSVSDKAMGHAKGFFEESDGNILDKGIPSLQTSITSRGLGFSTASGLKVSVSDKAMNHAKSFFEESDGKTLDTKACSSSESTHTPSQAIGFSTASGCKVSVSDKAMEDTKGFFVESEDSILDKGIGSEQTPTSSHAKGFSTAWGSKVCVSDKALHHAQNFLEKSESIGLSNQSVAADTYLRANVRSTVFQKSLKQAEQDLRESEELSERCDADGNGMGILSTTRLCKGISKAELELGNSDRPNVNRDFHLPLTSKCEDFLLDRKNVTGRRLKPLLAHNLTTNHGDNSVFPSNNSSFKPPCRKTSANDGGKTNRVFENGPGRAKDPSINSRGSTKTFIPPPANTSSVSSSIPWHSSQASSVKKNSSFVKKVPVFNPKKPELTRKDNSKLVVCNVEPDCDLDDEEENKLLCQEFDTSNNTIDKNQQEKDQNYVNGTFLQSDPKEEETKSTESKTNTCLKNIEPVTCKISQALDSTNVQDKTEINFESVKIANSEDISKNTNNMMSTGFEPPKSNFGSASSSALSESALEEARMKQEKIIRMKKRKRVSPLCGRWLETRKRKENLKRLEDVGEDFAQDWSKEQLLTCGVSSSTLDINSLNAKEFRFDLRRFFPCFNSSILIGDGALMVPDRFAFAGVTEFYSAFLTLDGVDPALVDEGWLENHYRWIVWKLASYEVSFPHHFAGRSLTPDHVMLQLKYRYDREIDNCQRSAFKKILEKDDTACKRMALCVASVIKDIDGQFSMELTDGWYSIKALMDTRLTDLVARKKLGPGDKIVTSGAELIGSQDACNPLEIKEGTRLKLHGNSTRPTPWHTRLGYCYPPSALCVPLNSLSPGGGMVGCVDVVITRKYPIMFMEKLPEGGCIFRTAEEEDRARQKYEDRRQAQLEKIYSSLQLESENQQKGSKRGSARLTRKEIENLWTGQEIAEAMDNAMNPEEFQQMLSTSQMERLMEHKRVEIDRRQDMMNKRLQEAMTDTGNESRNVAPVQKFKVCGCCSVDVSANASCVLTVWRPGPQWNEVEEGRRYKLFNLSASPARGRTDSRKVSLTTTRQTYLQAGSVSDNLLGLVFEPRETWTVSEVNSKQPGEEFDFAGVVVQVDPTQRTNGPNLVYAVDQDSEFICIRLWSGSQINNLKSSQCFVALNLVLGQNLQHSTRHRKQLLTADARSDMTVFSFSSHSCRYPDAFSYVDKLSKTKDFLIRMQEQLEKQLNSTATYHKEPSVANSHSHEACNEDFPPEILEKIFTPMSQELPYNNINNTGKLKAAPTVKSQDSQEQVPGTTVTCTMNKLNKSETETSLTNTNIGPNLSDAQNRESDSRTRNKIRDNKRKLEDISGTESSSMNKNDSQKLPKENESSEGSELLKKRRRMLKEKMTKLLAYDRPSPLSSLPNTSSPASGKEFKSPLLKK